MRENRGKNTARFPNTNHEHNPNHGGMHDRTQAKRPMNKTESQCGNCENYRLGIPRFIDSKFYGQNLQIRGDSR